MAYGMDETFGKMDDWTKDLLTPVQTPAPAAAVATSAPSSGIVSPGPGVTPLPKPVDKQLLPNTDGFATPGYQAQSYGNVLSGWEASKWNDPSHQTPKYVIGRILSNYPDNPGGLTAALADIQKAYPGASLVNANSGKINIPGVGTVDVGVSFGSGGGRGWAWQPVEEAATAPYQASSVFGPQDLQPANVMAPVTPMVAPTGKPAADGSMSWVPGAPVPRFPGMVYNDYGGFEAANTYQQSHPNGVPLTTYGQPTTGTQTAPTLEQAVAQILGQPTGAITGATNTAVPVPPSNQFTDPATATLDQLIRERIASLMSPINDPSQAQANQAIQDQIANLSRSLTTPAATQSFQDILAQVVQQLQGPTFSDPEWANLQTRAFDTLNRQEQDEIQNMVRALADRGVSPSSGLVEHATQQVRNKYDELKALQQQQLNQYAVDMANQRRSQMLQASQTGSNVALTQQAQDEARKAQVVDLATQLVNLARAARGEQSTNANQAISFAGVPVDITERRIANAVNAGAGGTSGANSTAQTLSNIIASFNNQTQTNQANSSSYLQDLSRYLSQVDWSKVFG